MKYELKHSAADLDLRTLRTSHLSQLKTKHITNGNTHDVKAQINKSIMNQFNA